MKWIGVFALLLLMGMAGCLPFVTPPPPLATDTPLPATTTPTPTTVWFPPTPTFTPLPAATELITPTLDTSPIHGALIFEDDFTTPGSWSTGKSGSGSIAFGQEELTLAVSRPEGYLYSLRQGASLADFYLEIVASPTICTGGDEYGLLLRVSPGLDFYRFALTCDGQTRLDRYYQGKASSPQPLTMSGAVPLGAPSSSILAVHAIGKELKFYVNGEYQFTVRDPILLEGGIGVFARSAGEGPVTVNFSDLKVYQPKP
jgi:hypothetical protein